MSKGYLLDTSVVSALAPGRKAFVLTPFGQWLQVPHEHLFLPDTAVAEMAQGIGKLRRHGAEGNHPGFADVAITVLAQHGDLVLLTWQPETFSAAGCGWL